MTNLACRWSILDLSCIFCGYLRISGYFRWRWVPLHLLLSVDLRRSSHLQRGDQILLTSPEIGLHSTALSAIWLHHKYNHFVKNVDPARPSLSVTDIHYCQCQEVNIVTSTWTAVTRDLSTVKHQWTSATRRRTQSIHLHGDFFVRACIQWILRNGILCGQDYPLAKSLYKLFNCTAHLSDNASLHRS